MVWGGLFLLYFLFVLFYIFIILCFIIIFLFFLVGDNGWLAAVPPSVGFAGWLFGGMDSKPLMGVIFQSVLMKFSTKNH